jgi:hypothetical protein
MDSLDTIGVLVLGLVIRFGIPAGVTALLVWFFRKLDQQWQAEAKLTTEGVMPKNPGCWKVNKCSAEDRAKCRAYANPDKPCWHVLRDTEGLLQEKCLGCEVFRKAPVPVLA